MPRLVSRPVMACFWLLLAVLIIAALLAWSVRVPSYTTASGVIRGQDHPSDKTVVVLFVPPEPSRPVRAGQVVHVQAAFSQQHATGVVVRLKPALVGPNEARQRYGAPIDSALIAAPSTAVVVRLDEWLYRKHDVGSRVRARVETGSRRVLSLFPGLSAIFGAGV